MIVQLCYLTINWFTNDGENNKLLQSNMATPFGHFFTLSMLCLSLLVALLLILNSMKYGIVSSGVLFNYWLILAICGAPQFRMAFETLIGFGQEVDNNNLNYY